MTDNGEHQLCGTANNGEWQTMGYDRQWGTLKYGI